MSTDSYYGIDLIFNDDSDYISCDKCEREFDYKEYKSFTCSACESGEEIEGEGEQMNDSISWSELAELTHETQVERFNFCLCEEQEQFPYADCPRPAIMCGDHLVADCGCLR